MHKNDILLGVNIDHVATLRQARLTPYPSPIYAAQIAETSGADGITLHLREDRRHIQVRDVEIVKELLTIPLNLEIAATDEMLQIACKIKPLKCCIVPEKREERTTEGGLDVVKNLAHLKMICRQLAEQNIEVSLFIEPDQKQIDASIACGVPTIELHTGHYADSVGEVQKQALHQIQIAATYAHQSGLIVNAGHGLHYHNVQAIAAIPELYELNIGHSIIAQAVFSGLANAVREMKKMMMQARV